MRAGSVFVKLVAIVKAASWLPLKLAYDKVIFVYYCGKKIYNLSKKCKADKIHIKKKHCVPKTQKKPPITILVFCFFFLNAHTQTHTCQQPTSSLFIGQHKTRFWPEKCEDIAAPSN